MLRDNQREWRQSWGTVEQVPSKCGVQGSVISLPLKSFCSLRAFVHTILWHSIIIAFSSVKTWVLACWWRRSDWRFARLIAPVVTTTAIDLSSNKIQNGDTLVPAYPGCPGNWPLNECYLTVPVIYRTEARILSNDKLKGSRVPELEHWSIGPPELCDGSIDATRSFIERKRQNVSMSVDVQVCSAGSVAACRQN